MSTPKTIAQIIAELAADPSNPVGRNLVQCPCIQALLEAVGQQVVSTKCEAFNEVNNDLTEWIDNQVVMLTLHISLRTLQTLRSNGTLPYTRINNKIYYLRRDVEKLLNDNYTTHQKTRCHDED